MIIGEEEFRALAADPPFAPDVPRFYFLRHGETDGNATGIVQSPSTPLNGRGRGQAGAAAAKLAERGIERMAASSYPRAYETAQIVARRLAVPMDATPGLGERLFGELAGRSALELDWRARPAGGETLEGFIRRARAGLEAALRGGGLACIVSHGGNLRVVTAGFGLALDDAMAANAVPIRFDRTPGGWRATIL